MSRKIRLQPNKETYDKLLKWFGCVRKTYNWTLDNLKKNQKLPINFIWLRNRFVNECNIPREFRYLLNTPKHIREGAIEDLVKGYKLNFAKGEHFEMKFRKRKDYQSITIPKESIKLIKENVGLKMYPTYLQNFIKMNTRRCSEVQYDCRMVLDKLGRIYLYVPMHAKVQENQLDKTSWAGLDPGVRTFMTLYSPQGLAFKYAVNDNVRLYRLCRHLDSLVSRTSTLTGRKKSRSQRAEQRLRYRIKHLVNECHWKVIHHMLTRFNNIVISPFEVKQMVKRKSRVLNNKTVRSMYNWSHYNFRMRLMDRAKKLGANVVVNTEEYTTKTCTLCGHINDVGSKKVIHCKNCHHLVDRDVNGSRNLFLKTCSIVQAMDLPR